MSICLSDFPSRPSAPYDTTTGIYNMFTALNYPTFLSSRSMPFSIGLNDGLKFFDYPLVTTLPMLSGSIQNIGLTGFSFFFNFSNDFLA